MRNNRPREPTDLTGGNRRCAFLQVDNIEKAALSIPRGEFSILLSHTPEVSRQAAHANFDLMLSGHTHVGQICVSGSIPIRIDAVLPRRMGAGPYHDTELTGYTSVPPSM